MAWAAGLRQARLESKLRSSNLARHPTPAACMRAFWAMQVLRHEASTQPHLLGASGKQSGGEGDAGARHTLCLPQQSWCCETQLWTDHFCSNLHPTPLPPSAVFGYNDAYCKLRPWLRKWRAAAEAAAAGGDTLRPLIGACSRATCSGALYANEALHANKNKNKNKVGTKGPSCTPRVPGAPAGRGS